MGLGRVDRGFRVVLGRGPDNSGKSSDLVSL